jgi:2-phosphosulfolactate phosphatase
MTTDRQLDVYLLPELVEPEGLAGRTAVVIDVLRATTTIVTALAAGATEVMPCLEIADAQRIAAQTKRPFVLGGERRGMPIAGFDLGNSPAEYAPEVVAGKTVVFTTTNGTRAMLRCKSARRLLLGAFVNFSAVCRELGAEERVALVCAGTDGQVTHEDTLLAGAVVDDLCRHAMVRAASPPRRWVLNDQAEIAADAWRAAVRMLIDRPLGMTLRDSRGGRNLIDIGHENDIELASQIDRFDMVPEVNLDSWRIVASGSASGHAPPAAAGG